ncbi:hypothetical protein CRI69_23960 [Escherichia sp. E4742]|nr:hypothetical protein CRI69_23960 [Escherichia sp. E4742]
MWAAPAFRERLGDFDATNTGAVYQSATNTTKPNQGSGDASLLYPRICQTNVTIKLQNMTSL